MGFILYCLITALTLQVIFKKRGSYTYRVFVMYLAYVLSSLYGIITSPVWCFLGERGSINYSVGIAGKFLLKHLLGITATIEGEEYLNEAKKSQAIYICNHQTFLDISFLSFIFPKKTSAVAKNTLRFYPFVGWFRKVSIMLSKTVFLDRSNNKNSVDKVKEAALEMRRMNQSLFIFPEGKRSNSCTNTLLPFKKGAFYMAAQAQVPIIPAVMCNYKEIYNAKKKHFGSGELKFKILPPVSTEGIPINSECIQKLSDDVRDQMLVALKEISPPDDE